MMSVVVSGIGVVAPGGTSPDAFWANLVSPDRVFSESEAAPQSGILVGRIDDAHLFDDLPLASLAACDRSALLAVAGARQALQNAGLTIGETIAADRVAVILGNGGGGLTSLDEQYARLYQNKRPHPFSVVRAMTSSSASWVSIAFGAQGPSFVTSSACASSSHAIGIAAQLIRAGIVDAAITGGTEAPLSRGTLLAWDAMKIMSRTSCRPFSRDRDGVIISEGAGILVLEREDHAKARGRVCKTYFAGFGSNADAGDIVAPTAQGMAKAMAAALDNADLSPADVSYVNAHGTGTRANDKTESDAMMAVFGDGRIPPTSSTKGVTGHTLGAAGAIEAVATILAMEKSIAPPTANLTQIDPDVCLDPIAIDARPMTIAVAVSNSFAFGGLNASLVFSRAA